MRTPANGGAGQVPTIWKPSGGTLKNTTTASDKVTAASHSARGDGSASDGKGIKPPRERLNPLNTCGIEWNTQGIREQVTGGKKSP